MNPDMTPEPEAIGEELDPFADDFPDQLHATVASVLDEQLEQLGVDGEFEQPTEAQLAELVSQLSEDELAQLEAALGVTEPADGLAPAAEQEAVRMAGEALEQLSVMYGKFDERECWDLATRLLPKMEKQHGEGPQAALAALHEAAAFLARDPNRADRMSDYQDIARRHGEIAQLTSTETPEEPAGVLADAADLPYEEIVRRYDQHHKQQTRRASP